MLDKLKKNRATQDRVPVVRPAVDIYETDKAICLEVDIPGITKEDLTVEVRDNSLILKGVRRRDKVEEKADVIYQERYPEVEYRREFALSAEVDQQNIQAAYRNGTLTVTLIKKQEAQPQKIAIGE